MEHHTDVRTWWDSLRLSLAPKLWRGLVLIFLVTSILGVHFRGLFGAPIRDAIWGISLSADPLGVISEAYERYAQSLRGCVDRVTTHSWPFGQELPPTWVDHVRPQALSMAGLLRLTGDPILAYNGSILLFFALNFFVTYAVMRRWVCHWYVALIPAVLLTFSVYAYAHSWAHLGLLPLFVFPVFFVLLSDFFATGRKSCALGAAGVAGLALYTSPYYFYFLSWMGGVLTTVRFVRNPADIRTRRTWINLGFFFFALALLVFPFWRDQYLIDYSLYWDGPDIARHYGDDMRMLQGFTARPRDYVLSNIHHFLYGDFLKGFIADGTPFRSPYSDELPIYLGLGPILFVLGLMVVCGGRLLPVRVRRTLRGRSWGSLPRPFAHLPHERKSAATAGLILAVCAFLLSLPPTMNVGGLDVPLPNELLRHVLPFRSYARFGVVVLIGLLIPIMLVVDRTRRPWLWTVLLLALGVFESTPKTYLHKASREVPSIRFLRERPERVIMRLERQNIRLQRAVELEALLADKYVLNGSVNLVYGFSDWLLQESLRWPFLLGHLRDMGVELLVVNGRMEFGPRDRSYAERIASFPEENIEIWKLQPSGDPRLARVFEVLINKRKADGCYVASKAEAEAVVQQYFRALQSR